MRRGVVTVFLAIAAALVLMPAVASAQDGQIAGIVRDTSGAVMPGVTVEATSPALIEKVRAATTDASGQYRIINLPVGTYTVTFMLTGFTRQQSDGVVLTSGFTAPVNATMTVGQLTETVVVSGAAAVVDVQNAREVITFEGDQIKELPTSRNVNSLLMLTPAIQSNYRPTSAFGAPGVCVGGIGVFCNPGVNGFNVGDTDTTNLAQGRVLVDGQVVNAGGSVPIVGQTGGYTADIANAQEVNIQVSGALGESETGGATINIVPKTGGNRFAGDFNTTYTDDHLFSKNNGAYANLATTANLIRNDHDVAGSFGGPIKRDRLWFYAVARDQGIHKLPVGVDFWPNLNEGKWGYNYQPDRSKPRVEYTNQWRNANTRFTWQATQKNKINMFWDEQDFCQDPCTGVVSVYTSPESWWSSQSRPNRLQQVSWTNPRTNKVLLEGGLSVTTQRYSTASHREYDNPIDIPRISEIGDTAGMDSVAPRVNQFAGGAFFALTSGSLNSAIGAGGAEVRELKNYRTRGAVSYVTGTHHFKVGYDGGHYSQLQTNKVNNPQLTYNYMWPNATCATVPGGCGNASLQFPDDPENLNRRPIPQTVDFNTGSGTLDDHVMYVAFYGQDQWTFGRFTLSGALRFDRATSGYGETCIGPNKFVPLQANGQGGYCTPETSGVAYKDLTPRWGGTWDIFGTGRTALKINGGKFLNAAGISGVYSNANPARRAVNTLRRNWNDANGNRIVDCDLMNVTPNGECGTFVQAPGANPRTDDTLRYGRDPLTLDASGIPVGLATVQCGRSETGISPAVIAYCDQYGESLVGGWGRRRSEWQFGVGIQHEILPRLSGELTWNYRRYVNLTVQDTLGVGCDRYGAQDLQTCQQALLNYSNPSYDFYSVTAPSDPRLPNGGGYRVLGLFSDRFAAPPTGTTTVETYSKGLEYDWNGFDTNFTWRGPYGLRFQGGTNTSRNARNFCDAVLDAVATAGGGALVNLRGREGAEHQAGCDTHSPFQTSLRASASYTVPKVDVLVSTVFQSLPGTDISANMTFQKEQVVWNAESAGRAAEPCQFAFQGVGCLGATRNTTTTSVNLLLNNEVFGERVTYFDMKLAKVFRFAGRRANVGVDVYNVLNSDAITAYNATYTPDNPATTANENTWMQPQALITPRYVRLQVQLTF